MWRGLSCVKVAGRRRKSPQKKKKRAQRPTDHRMHLNWFIKAPTVHPPPPRFSPLNRLRPPRPSPRRPGLRVRHPAPVPRFSRAVHQPPWYDPMESRNTPRSRCVHTGRASTIQLHAYTYTRTHTHTLQRMQRVTSYLSRQHRNGGRRRVLRHVPESATRAGSPSPANYDPRSPLRGDRTVEI